MDRSFLTIRQVAQLGLLPENCLRMLEHQGRLPGIYVGKKKLVNVSLLLEQLDRESVANAQGRD